MIREVIRKIGPGRIVFYLMLLIFIPFFSHAQKLDGIDGEFLFTDFVQETPEEILRDFQDLGMEPTLHQLTAEEKIVIDEAYKLLPPLHQKILQKHLFSISFLDNMPNTALTSPVDISGIDRKFTITFRSEILHQTISEWATWKEESCYVLDPNYEIIVNAGDLNAIVYILLHEATHVLDDVLGISSKDETLDSLSTSYSFAKGVWLSMNIPVKKFNKDLLKTTRFRGGSPLPISLAPEVYQNLRETPFVSLYGMASWFEDLAEFTTIYHLTKVLDQPFQIQILKEGRSVMEFCPMENPVVLQRLSLLSMFYETTTLF